MGKQQTRVSRPSKSPRESSKEIPFDLLIGIFSRLPAEDVARCRCVSKLWSFVLRRPEFTQLFLKVSSAQPRILFSFLYNGRRIFYSMPQELDPDGSYNSPISPHYHMHFPKGLGYDEEICPPIHGLVCTKSTKPMICNPSTGEYISLLKATTNSIEMISLFGYDPVDKLYKVLCVSDDYVCRVVTLGTSEVTWRRVECSIPHQTLDSEICIDGMLYYLAAGNETDQTHHMIVCFDVRFERFKFLAVGLNIEHPVLINYNGNLGVIWKKPYGIDTIELRVLEDADEVKWSRTVYILPSYWNIVAANTDPIIVGMTNGGEIVLSTYSREDPPYVFYFNPVKDNVVRVEIDFEINTALSWKCSDMATVLNHVENVEIMGWDIIP